MWGRFSRSGYGHISRAAVGVLLMIAILWPATASAQAVPTIPDAVPVELDAATTAYLLLDMNVGSCGRRTTCVASVVPANALLERARAAGALIVFTTSGANAGGSPLLPEVAPGENEYFYNTNADKFYATLLDDLLRSKGIQTLVIIGTAANGAPLYTSFGATERGYTVVVAEDAISEDNPFAVVVARWQLLNQPGYTNPTNTPLANARVTLSRTDMITFR